jgi:hypothetical protein
MCRHATGTVHGQLAAAAQRQAAHGGHHRHLGVAHAQHGVLQLLVLGRDALGSPGFMNTGISASRLAPAENTSSGDQITKPG